MQLPNVDRWKGKWGPGLQPDLSLVAMLALLVEVIGRGVDYAGGDAVGVTQALTVIEAAMPLQMWGALCLIAAAFFGVGIWLRRFGAIIFGGVLITATYGSLSVGLFMRMVERGWPWDGWRTPIMFVIIAILSALYALSAYLKHAAVKAEESMKRHDPGEDDGE